MGRDKRKALVILQIVEVYARLDGVPLSEVRQAIERQEHVFDAIDLYHIELLVQGGYLLKTPLGESHGASVQLTWKGHDLLDDLRRDPAIS